MRRDYSVLLLVFGLWSVPQGAYAQFCVFGCDDNDPCTSDQCLPIGIGICSHVPRDCNDGNLCTLDSCVPVAFGAICLHQGPDCDDGDPCTIDTCETPGSTCAPSVPNTCDDGDACTADSCDAALGCLNDVISCDDGDECTGDSCDPGTGCAHESLDCIDFLACSPNELICKWVDYHDADGDGIIEVAEPTTFDVVIEVQNLTGGLWSGVVVSDRFGGEISAAVTVVPGVNPTQGTVKIGAKGATQKQTVTWTIGNLPAGGNATLVISARTDLNPGGSQQFTTCGTHAFNSGAVLKYTNIKRVKFSEATESINLTVLTADLAGDCDGDGASDGEELDAGTDPLDPTDVPPSPGACSDGSQPVENCIGSGDVPIPCCSVPNGTICPSGQPNYECFVNGVNIFCCSPN